MPRIAIIKPACSALLIPFSISAVPQEAARADAASGHRRFQLAARATNIEPNAPSATAKK